LKKMLEAYQKVLNSNIRINWVFIYKTKDVNSQILF
jgi:hypothetical protein